jgi:hypothetical protein
MMSEQIVLGFATFGMMIVALMVVGLTVIWSINWISEKEFERERRRRNELWSTNWLSEKEFKGNADRGTNNDA